MTGVCPRRRQVDVTGSSEAPDSSQNTITARRRRALARILWAVLSDPAGDGLLVALDRAAGGALQPPAMRRSSFQGGRMVAGPGQLFDHGGDAGQGPVVAVEAMGAGALAQGRVDDGTLGVRQARVRPGGTAASARQATLAIGRASGWRSAGRRRAGGRPRLGCGRRQASAPACMRMCSKASV